MALRATHVQVTSFECVAAVSHGVNESLSNVLTNHSLNTRAVESLDIQLQLAIQEERDAVAVLAATVDDPVSSAAVVSSSVLLHHVPNVDHVRALLHGHRDPGLGRGIPDLQTLSVRLLQ